MYLLDNVYRLAIMFALLYIIINHLEVTRDEKEKKKKKKNLTRQLKSLAITDLEVHSCYLVYCLYCQTFLKWQNIMIQCHICKITSQREDSLRFCHGGAQMVNPRETARERKKKVIWNLCLNFDAYTHQFALFPLKVFPLWPMYHYNSTGSAFYNSDGLA